MKTPEAVRAALATCASSVRRIAKRNSAAECCSYIWAISAAVIVICGVRVDALAC
ncbi:MAG: hypothetical protein WAP35_08890 [Solirubrobacterales bacterium]